MPEGPAAARAAAVAAEEGTGGLRNEGAEAQSLLEGIADEACSEVIGAG